MTIVRAILNIIGVAIIAALLAVIIAVVSFGITFGARSGWRLSERCVPQLENVEGSIRSTTVNP